MKRVMVSLRELDIERLDALADKLKLGRSDLLRRILDEYFEQLEED